MSHKTEKKKDRIDIIDALRGLAVTLMVIHHAMFIAMTYLGAPRYLYSNPVFDVLQAFFVGLFVCISGVSSRFSRGNVERGAIVIVFAVLITYVTTRMNMPINFGILHLLGSLMIFYGLTRKFWDKIPRKVAPFIYIVLGVASAVARSVLTLSSDNLIGRDLLSVLGWRQQGFISLDYQPILPAIFVFLFGTWAGQYIKEGKFPDWFYKMKVPFFPFVGRNALAIYMIHQPVFFGVAMLILWLGA